MGIKTKRFIAARKSCSCSMPGVWRAVAYCEGTVVIFHSPKACSHVARSMDINSHYSTLAESKAESKRTVPLLSSCLQEKHSIFGGADELSRCIDFAVEKYQPECIVIANSCVAGVIGDDVESVAAEAEQRHAVPVLTVDCYGFLDGEYYQGYFETATAVLKRFAEPQPKEARTAVLLGDNGGPWGHYAVEVTRMLGYMGVKVIGQFPGYMSLKEIRELPRAEFAIVLGGRGLTGAGLEKLAAFLQERYDVKYIKGVYPVGTADTEKWLFEVGKLLRCEEKVSAIRDGELRRLRECVGRFLAVTENKRTVLCIGRWLMYFNPAVILEIIEFLKLDLAGVVLLDAYDEKTRAEMHDAVKQCSSAPIYDSVDGEKIISEAELILTTHELQGRTAKQIFLPMLPKVGVAGEIEMMEVIYRALCSRMTGGGIIYA